MSVFVSYAKTDENIARQVTEYLGSRGIEAVTADDVVSVGQPWASAVSRAIGAADAVIVLASSASAQSTWSSLEAALATARRFDSSARVIPIFLGDPAEAPFFLRQLQGLDFSNQNDRPKQFERLEKALKMRGPPQTDAQVEMLFSAIRDSSALLDHEERMYEIDRRLAAVAAGLRLTLVLTTLMGALMTGSLLLLVGLVVLDGSGRFLFSAIAAIVAAGVFAAFAWKGTGRRPPLSKTLDEIDRT